MNFFRQFLLGAILLTAFSALADFQSGLEAIARRDFAAALKIFKPLAENGNAAAQVNLGNLYMKGWGVEQDYPLAQTWFRKAADQGERMAQSKLGILYYHGLGVRKDATEAANWFRKAAEQGETTAQAILGTLYAEGEGVPKDFAQAFYWYTMAEEQGNQEASRGRKSLEEEMTPGQRDEALRLLSETRRRRTEEEEKAFESATAGLGTPPEPQVASHRAKKPAGRHGKSKRKTKGPTHPPAKSLAPPPSS